MQNQNLHRKFLKKFSNNKFRSTCLRYSTGNGYRIIADRFSFK